MSTGINKPPGLHQLPFSFHLYESYTFENFYAPPNDIIVKCLKRLIEDTGLTHSIYLWGHPLVGCTHLLKACVAAAHQAGLKAIYLSLSDVLNHATAEVLQSLTSYQIVCLDELEVISKHSVWEEGLFALYNQLKSQGTPIIFGAHQVPYQLSLGLPDLTSRLNSGLLFQVRELNDVQKVEALQLRAQLRGLELPEPVANFLISRLPRSHRVLLDALNQLDLFALAKKRKLTMPFVKEVLEL